MDRKILALEATRDLTKTWAHVDMDAFYAAAEELANPSLVKPSFLFPGMLCADWLQRRLSTTLIRGFIPDHCHVSTCISRTV